VTENDKDRCVALSQPAAVEGWKLVPVEPTEAMLDDGHEALDDQHHTGRFGECHGLNWSDAEKCYRAMLSAAPAPPSAPVQQSVRNALRRAVIKLPCYSFLSPKEGGVVRVDDACGRWIERDEVIELFESEKSDALIASLSASPAGNKVEGERVTLRASDLLSIIDFIAPDRTEDELETEVAITYHPARYTEDGSYINAGYWASYAEYPDAGAVHISASPLLDKNDQAEFRKVAEQQYMEDAFDYEKDPVGSRDWSLYWMAWQACAHYIGNPQPPVQKVMHSASKDAPDSNELGEALREIANMDACPEDFSARALKIARAALAQSPSKKGGE
jgi:hypothetical protein